MNRTRIGAACVVSLTALAAAITLGALGGRLTRGPDRITAVADTFAFTAEPGLVSGAKKYLAAGGHAGGAAISYLTFDVDLPAKRVLDRAWLWLARESGELPDLVELSLVNDVRWLESRLNGQTAPRLGTVVGSVAPGRHDDAIAFDVTSVVQRSGRYGFAVTSPTGTAMAKFMAREVGDRKSGPPTITFEWSALPPAHQPDVVRPRPPVPPMINPPVRPQLPALPSGWALPTRLPWSPPWGTPPPSASIAGPSTLPTVDPSPAVTLSASPSWTASVSPGVTTSPIASPSPTDSSSSSPSAAASASPSDQASPSLSAEPSPAVSPSSAASPSTAPDASPAPSTVPSATPQPSPSPSDVDPACKLGPALVPTCGVLWGVAPGAHTNVDRAVALTEFERRVQKPQAVYHSYHRGRELFPTAQEIGIARDAGNPRTLFMNWKPTGVTWAQIAAGHASTDAFLDELAAHLKANFTEQFFFTVHHEPENDVRATAGSGMTATDYAAMFRHVIERLRGAGVTNLVSTMTYMAYVPFNVKSWFEQLYPGDDVVDWVAWDSYAYSDPGYGYGDFAEMMNRVSSSRPGWTGFYNWAAQTFPTKPLMVGEWGVWYSQDNPEHQADFFDSARLQLEAFPRVKAMVYFESPDAEGRDSRVHVTPGTLAAFQRFSKHPAFTVQPFARQAADGVPAPVTEP